MIARSIRLIGLALGVGTLARVIVQVRRGRTRAFDERAAFLIGSSAHETLRLSYCAEPLRVIAGASPVAVVVPLRLLFASY